MAVVLGDELGSAKVFRGFCDILSSVVDVKSSNTNLDDFVHVWETTAAKEWTCFQFIEFEIWQFI